MQKGISDWAFRGLGSGEDLIRMASQMHFDGIEFNLYECDAPITLKSSSAEIKRLANAAVDNGMRLPSLATGLHNYYSLTSADEKIRRQGEDIVLRMLEIATQLGSKTILVVPGHVDADVPYDQAYATAQEALHRLAPEAHSAGVTIGIENVWNKFLISPLEFVHFLDELNHPSIKAYFDVGNAVNAGFPEQWIRLLGRRLAAVHVKDFRAGAGYGHTVPFFNGDVNWSAVIHALYEAHYDGYLMATPLPYSILPERLMHTAAHDLTAIMAL